MLDLLRQPARVHVIRRSSDAQAVVPSPPTLAGAQQEADDEQAEHDCDYPYAFHR